MTEEEKIIEELREEMLGRPNGTYLDLALRGLPMVQHFGTTNAPRPASKNEEVMDKYVRALGKKSGLGLPGSFEMAFGTPSVYDKEAPYDAVEIASAAGAAKSRGLHPHERFQDVGGFGSRSPYPKDNAKVALDVSKNASKDYEEGVSANSLEAERNKTRGFLGINKRDDGSTYFTGSEQIRQNLEKTISDYDREIAKLQAEIAMSEAGDPMYDLAVMRMIMNNDNSLMNDIRGRIGKKIDQEFQMKMKKADQDFQHEENELTRESNKQEREEEKKKDRKRAYERALQTYEFAVQDLRADPSKPELKRNVEKAQMLLRQAASDANMLDDYYRMFDKPEDTSTLADFDKAFVEYEVEGIEGLKNYVNSIKNPKEKARVLRDLKNSFGITEGDLGLSGAETKINQKKADENAALEKDVNAQVGKTFDTGKAAKDYLDTLPKNVRDRLTAKYDKASKKTKLVKRN